MIDSNSDDKLGTQFEHLELQLAEGVKALDLNLPRIQSQKLLKFLELLNKWNHHFNLTSITDFSKMVSHHLLDSLSIVPYITGTAILDFGSGAGLPGIPLACYFPEKKFVLVESVGKKASFILHVCAQLGLKNVEVIGKRVEHLSDQNYRFDCIVSRAVCNMQKLITLTYPLSKNDTRWIAMKGVLSTEELSELQLPYKTWPLKILGIESERNVVIITR